MNDPACTKSTSGVFFEVRGRNTRLPIDFLAKTQEATARSTPEAELYALDYGVHMAGIPLGLQWSALSGTGFALSVMEDNSAVVSTVERGLSRKLSYLTAKKERASIGALHEFFHGDPDYPDTESPNHLLKESSEAQVADALTKPLEVDDHWENCRQLGLRPVDVPVTASSGSSSSSSSTRR